MRHAKTPGIANANISKGFRMLSAFRVAILTPLIAASLFPLQRADGLQSTGQQQSQTSTQTQQTSAFRQSISLFGTPLVEAKDSKYSLRFGHGDVEKLVASVIDNLSKSNPGIKQDFAFLSDMKGFLTLQFNSMLAAFPKDPGTEIKVNGEALSIAGTHTQPGFQGFAEATGTTIYMDRLRQFVSGLETLGKDIGNPAELMRTLKLTGSSWLYTSAKLSFGATGMIDVDYNPLSQSGTAKYSLAGRKGVCNVLYNRETGALRFDNLGIRPFANGAVVLELADKPKPVQQPGKPLQVIRPTLGLVDWNNKNAVLNIFSFGGEKTGSFLYNHQSDAFSGTLNIGGSALDTVLSLSHDTAKPAEHDSVLFRIRQGLLSNSLLTFDDRGNLTGTLRTGIGIADLKGLKNPDGTYSVHARFGQHSALKNLLFAYDGKGNRLSSTLALGGKEATISLWQSELANVQGERQFRFSLAVPGAAKGIRHSISGMLDGDELKNITLDYARPYNSLTFGMGNTVTIPDTELNIQQLARLMSSIEASFPTIMQRKEMLSQPKPGVLSFQSGYNLSYGHTGKHASGSLTMLSDQQGSLQQALVGLSSGQKSLHMHFMPDNTFSLSTMSGNFGLFYDSSTDATGIAGMMRTGIGTVAGSSTIGESDSFARALAFSLRGTQVTAGIRHSRIKGAQPTLDYYLALTYGWLSLSAIQRESNVPAGQNATEIRFGINGKW